MWPAVLLPLGIVLVIGGVVGAALFLRKQIPYGVTRSAILAGSDITMTVIVGLSMAIFSATKNLKFNDECNEISYVAGSAIFLVPFINSFVSMLVSALDGWNNIKSLCKRPNIAPKRITKFPTSGITAQWGLPLVAILALYIISKGERDSLNKFIDINNTCYDLDVPYDLRSDQCLSNSLNAQDDVETSNLTSTIVNNIYRLINDSINQTTYSGSYLRNNEEWRNIFIDMMLKYKNEDKKGKINANYFKQSSNATDLPTNCIKMCLPLPDKLHKYLTGILAIGYILPLLGSALLHQKCNVLKKIMRRTNETESELEANILKIKCSAQHIKNTTLSGIVMWTPTVTEKLAQNWLQEGVPCWIVVVLFLLGQMYLLVRIFCFSKFSQQSINAIQPQVNGQNPAQSSSSSVVLENRNKQAHENN